MEFELTSLNIEINDRSNPDKWTHAHDNHELLYCLNGRGTQLGEHGEEKITAGDFFFFPKGKQHHSYCYPGESFRCMVINADERVFSRGTAADAEALAMMDTLIERTQGQHRVEVSQSALTRLKPLFFSIHDEFEEKRLGYYSLLKGLLTQILVTVFRDPGFTEHRPSRQKPSHEKIVQDAINYLEAFYMNPVSVDDVLKVSPLSRSHFHAVFKDVTGVTMVTYLQRIRLQQAIRHMLKRNVPVSDVASLCGFNSQSYFNHVFKDVYGMSPTRYIRSRVESEFVS